MRRTVAVIVVVLTVAVIWWLRHGADAPGQPARQRSRVVSSAPVAPPRREPRGAQPWRDPDPVGGLRLEGQVLGPDGRGVAGATVVLAQPARTVVAEGDGSFAFDQLPAGNYQLDAVQGELIGGPVYYRLSEHGDPALIRLSGGAAVVVTVVDEAAQPVGRAQVHVRTGAPARVITADERGIARIAPVQASIVVLEVVAEGFAAARAQTMIGAAGTTIDLTVVLRRGFPISGRVVDEHGAPIANAQVSPFANGADKIATAVVVTDASGGFITPSLAPGAYQLAVVDGEHAAALSAMIPVKDRAVGPITIAMAAGGVISGRVVDRTRSPLAGARVSAVARDGDPIGYRRGLAGADGRFELRGLGRTQWEVTASTPELGGAGVAVDLRAGAAAELELVLELDGSIEGVVVDERGAPVPEVIVIGWRGRVPSNELRAITNGEGRFAMRGLEDGDYRLDADWRNGGERGYSTGADFGTPAHTGDRNVRLVLQRPGLVIGRIVVDGAAPREVMVYVGQSLTKTAPDGSFRVEVAAGDWQMLMHGDELADIMRNVVVAAGATVDLGTIVGTRGRTLRGRVTPPREGLRVALYVGRGPIDDNVLPMRTAPVAGDGSFAVYGLPELPTLVRVEDVQRAHSAAQPVPVGKADPPAVTLSPP